MKRIIFCFMLLLVVLFATACNKTTKNAASNAASQVSSIVSEAEEQVSSIVSDLESMP